MNMTTNNRGNSIEFIVMPKQDLFLEGGVRRLPRVSKGEPYPCQMQKSQNFSCLFRHYAKHNGLKKEDLVFTFVDELLPEQTPESVHLMQSDEIWVEHRKSSEQAKGLEISTKAFFDQFGQLLRDGSHADVYFLLNDRVTVPAHKGVLSARSSYFQAMFQEGGLSESSQREIRIGHEASTFRLMLEFIYTNDVQTVKTLPEQELVNLLIMANEFLISDLKLLCESAVVELVSKDNVSKLLLLADQHDAGMLRKACEAYIKSSKDTLKNDSSLRSEVEFNPELGWLLFQAMSNDAEPPNFSGEGSNSKKRRRYSDAADNDMDLNPPQLNSTVNSVNSTGNTNTIAQSNANIQDI